MPVINLAAGQAIPIGAGVIPGSMYVYVVGPGTARYTVQVGGGPVWNYIRPAGDTERVAVNNAAVNVSNAGPSRIQLLYVNAEKALTLADTELAVLADTHGTRGGRGRADVLGEDESAAQQAMQTLTAQYYNALVAGCGLSPGNFQLYQCHLPLGQLSEDLWHIFDAVPPLSIAQYYDPSQFNMLSQDYGAVINHLNPQNGDKFQAAMGDYYSAWTTFLKTNPAIPAGGILQLFKNWSDLNMPPDKAQTCYTLYQQISQDAIVLGVQAWLNMQNAAQNPGIAAYDQTVEGLQHALAGAQSQAFTLDSETESSNIEHTWAQAEAGGVLDWFWGGGKASYEKWTEQITNAGVTIAVKFQKLVTFAAGPLYQPSKDPILANYTPWFNSAALHLGFANDDNTVWQHGAPTWQSTFGPSGNLQRRCSALIVVDGITVTTSAAAGIATGDQEDFKSSISAGFFPFFEASGSGGWSHDTTFDDHGNFTIESTCVAGNPQVIGVLVTPIANLFTLARPSASGTAEPASEPAGAAVRKQLVRR